MWASMSSCSGVMRAVGHLDPHHLVVAALALAVDAVVQAEDAEDVLVELAGEVAGELLARTSRCRRLRPDRSLAAAWRRPLGWCDVGTRPADRSEVRQSRSGFTMYQIPTDHVNICRPRIRASGRRHAGVERRRGLSLAAARRPGTPGRATGGR